MNDSPDAVSDGQGSLTVVGLGPARAGHVTLEAADVLRQAAASERARAYGVPHAGTVALEIAPGLRFRPLDAFYDVDAVPRQRIYDDLAELLLRRALDDGFDVLYLTPGSPLIYNDVVWHIRRACRARSMALRIVHGMSFLDVVLEKVFWTGRSGLQLYSAWNVAVDRIRISPDAPALLCQLGECSPDVEAVGVTPDGRLEGSREMLERAARELSKSHPADHPAIVLSSSGHPDDDVVSTRVTIETLPSVAPVPVYSNLFLPAVGGPNAERDTLP